jgi:hypothetical protein
MAKNAKRQVDLGFVDVLTRGQILAIDFTVSDGGGSKPQLPYITGALCEQKAKEKHDLYHGSNGRFEGLKDGQLVVPSYDAMGGCSKETEVFTLHLIKAVAAANTEDSFATTSRFVWTAISCALIRAIAANALDFRVGKLLEPSRKVGRMAISSKGNELRSPGDLMPDLRGRADGSSKGSGSSKAQGSQGSQGSGGASQRRRTRQQGLAKRVTDLMTRAVGAVGVGLECSGSSQGLEGHGGEGFLSDSFVGVASLSQAGSERRVSHDAGVDVLAE